MPTLTKPKKIGEIFTFYGGTAQVEKVPFGDYFRYRKPGDGRSYLLSSTRITKNVDKGNVLTNWAIGRVIAHVRSKLEQGAGPFSREEIDMFLVEAQTKPDEAKEAAGGVGKMIHEFAHEFAKAKLNVGKMPDINDKRFADERIVNGISAFLDWYNKNDVEFLEMEKLVYYNSTFAKDSVPFPSMSFLPQQIEYVGILDLIAKVNGVTTVVDYKTSKGVYSDQRYQVASYRHAWNKLGLRKNGRADASLILNFNKETGALIEKHIDVEEHERDLVAFLGQYQVAVREKQLTADR